MTYITKNDGVYSFDNHSRTEDYNLVASFNGKKTPVKKLSHFDQQPSSMRILTFEPPEQSAASSATQK